MRIGTRLPTTGPDANRAGIVDRARELEAAGFDSLWVSDHVVQPETIQSRYPYSADGTTTWDPAIPQVEALVALAAVAAVTERVELGTAVLVVPQRQAVLLAKQLASIDAIAPGRVVLGAGAGWLAEEFQALGADFARRGAVLDETIDVLRDCWTGRPPARTGIAVDLPAGIVVAPAPAQSIPVLVGGMSGPAIRRAIARGDGWIAQTSCTAEGAAEVVRLAARLREEAEVAGRTAPLRIAARLSGGDAQAAALLLPVLAAAGVDDVVLDTPPAGDAARAIELLRDTLA
ncbi:TIGR03619 family F420-dependent LLM class oxidoreductase [Homoserinibacter sp. GY 40078]|uniref:TIGR03619 family F420-dependent LLM class oxidoreductase n=1 Tax=Homoserinibacter sp. GY 40078 TaxID=2603275 RepID=UPI0011CCB598|nr:TIGR03619 family F420-dependent LLM class oxidoreductase [Homoserinibacter sp. GY 40078]TXK16968.1 TIGR03619 family F420-dependent LLM class oxidoreductase [Homoserinibacter sp. GY 40078]